MRKKKTNKKSGVIGYWNKSVIAESFRLIKNNPKNFFNIVLLDVLFIITAYIISVVFKIIVPANPQQLLALGKTVPVVLLTGAFFILLYGFILLVAYSFFKYNIIHLIGSFNKKVRFSFSNLWNFILLNIINFAIIIAAFIILNILLYFLIQNQYLQFFAFIMLIPLLYLSYFIIQTSHIVFIKEKKIFNNLKKTYSTVFKNGKHFYVFGYMAAAFILYVIVYNILIYIIGIFANPSLQNTAQAYSTAATIKNVLLVITGVVIYAIHSTARNYLYLIIKKTQSI